MPLKISEKLNNIVKRAQNVVFKKVSFWTKNVKICNYLPKKLFGGYIQPEIPAWCNTSLTIITSFHYFLICMVHFEAELSPISMTGSES